jgi:biopolymer transport protein ExbD
MSEMAFRSRRHRKEVTLNVTSLVDVLFLLLIFFMLTGTFKRAGELELQLPDSSSATPADGTEAAQIELVITEDGRLLVDGAPVGFPQLKGRLESLRSADPGSRVMIKAEAGVQHGDVVRILDMVREAGFPGVGIGTHIQNTGGGK